MPHLSPASVSCALIIDIIALPFSTSDGQAPHHRHDGCRPGSVPIPTATIRELSEALDAGALTSVDLVALYLERIAFFDRTGIRLNAVPVLNSRIFEEAREADRQRRLGARPGPLLGIPFVVKDSYGVEGLTVAAGSPAFQDLRAGEDAGAVALLREAGALLLGKTTMPPMAAGGMQRGVYGRPKSPYNPARLPAAWLSGSSSGSAVAVAAGLGGFGLGEETLSSGRSPASHNGLVSYVPSRGMISLRGNWPLMALRDQPAPYARTVSDLLDVLDVLVQDDDRDPATAFDLWRDQSAVELPAPSTVRPRAYRDLLDPAALDGTVVGIPRLFVGKDTTVTEPFRLDPNVERLWHGAEEDLRALGATVAEVDPPAFYQLADLSEASELERLGYWPRGFAREEWVELIAATWETFLRQNGDPEIASLGALQDISSIFPEEFHGLGPEVNPMGRYDYGRIGEAAAAGTSSVWGIDGIAEVLAGLERCRKELLEDWMDEQGIDLLAFPVHSGTAPTEADRDLAAALRAWAPGVNYALGGAAMRILGIPSVVVPMGSKADDQMPVGVTFAGRAYSDNVLLAVAAAYEDFTHHRTDPMHAPVGPQEWTHRLDVSNQVEMVTPAKESTEGSLRVKVLGYDGDTLRIAIETTGATLRTLRVTVDGVWVPGARPGDEYQELSVPRPSSGPHSSATGPQAGLVVAVGTVAGEITLGAFAEFDRPKRWGT